MLNIKLKRLIKNRLVILSCLLFLSGFVAVVYINMNMNVETFYKSMVDIVVPTSVNYALDTLDNAYDESRIKLSLLTGALKESTLFSLEEDSGIIAEALAHWQDELGVQNIGAVSLHSGKYYDSSGGILELDTDTERDSWIADFLNQEEDYRINIYKPESPWDYSLYSVFHDAKIYDGDEVIGIIGYGVSHDFYADFGRINSPHNNVVVMFLDENGEVRLPLLKSGRNIRDIYGIEKSDVLVKAAEGRTVSCGNLPEDEVHRLMHFRYLPKFDRYVLIEIDITPYYEDFRLQHRRNNMIIALTGALIVLLNFVVLFLSSHRLSVRAYTDNLTGCYNRSYANRLIKKIDRRCKGGWSIILFDIDLFKEVNDEDGHAAGDLLLRRVAMIASGHLRAEDFLFRWGGDEFLALLKTDGKNAVPIAGRIKEAVDIRTAVSISVGLSSIHPDETFSAAFERADAALYKAKREGRNRLHIINEPGLSMV